MLILLKLRITLGGLYVSFLAKSSVFVQKFVQKDSAAGTLLARIKRRLWSGPVPRLGAMLEAISRARPVVRFVQIGANDGVLHDPLRPFILKYRWHGLLVEPLPDIFERLKHNYSGQDQLAFENSAIAAQPGVRDFYYVAAPDDTRANLPPWYAGLGSLSRDTVLKHAREFPEISRHLASLTIRCVTFDAACERHGIGDLDLIVIDAEGHDFEILNQIDLDRHKPLLIVYEHHHMSATQAATCRERLARYGYECFEEFLDTVCFRSSFLDARDKPLQRVWHELRRVKWLPM